jgi:DNA-binding Lrp family transcriptional regulator
MYLDRIDFALLDLLRKNARMPNKDLAQKCGIAPSTALERIRRLREQRAILGYHAEIAPQAVGIGLQAMVSIRLTRHSRDLLDAFHAHLLGLCEVLSFYHVGGVDDFLVHVGVRDTDHLRDFALSAFASREEVDRFETRIIFEFQRNPGVPIYIETE